MRTARIKGEDGAFYHCMSRVLERRFLLGDGEKEKFLKLMRSCEGFCGVQVVTYALMSNHFHILVHVPGRGEISDEAFLERLGFLYSKIRVKEIARQLKAYREEADNEGAERLKTLFTYRMGDVSEFIKTLKQRFTQWYNKRQGRRGTLWEERFKSVLVEGRGHVLATMAAYIDLNAVRAGLVEDPKDFRFCGYGEAVAGGRLARAGLAQVALSLGQKEDWRSAGAAYRVYVHVRGEQNEASTGFAREKVKQVLEEKGTLSQAEVLRCRVRYFSDGVVLGSRDFVERMFSEHRSFFGPKRKTGARPLRSATLGDVFTARDLRLEPITVPATGG
jgi:putative transposase